MGRYRANEHSLLRFQRSFRWLVTGLTPTMDGSTVTGHPVARKHRMVFTSRSLGAVTANQKKDPRAAGTSSEGIWTLKTYPSPTFSEGLKP